MFTRLTGFCVLALWLAANASAAPHNDMDYGPFLSGTFETQWPDGNTVLKGIAIRLDASAAHLPNPEGPIGGGVYSLKPMQDVLGTDEQAIYKAQRFRFGGYVLNVPDGEYQVTLKFADCWQTKPGIRVFDVLLQDQTVLEQLDLIARVGHGKAFDHTTEKVKVTDGQLKLTFRKHSGEPTIAAIIIEGDDFSRKINCGGPAVADYAADWEPNFVLSDEPNAAGVIFDTELCRYAACWRGGFLNLRGIAFDGVHGVNPSVKGQQQLGTLPLPGVAKAGQFADPRGIPHGPLPRDWAKYQGLYRHEDGIVLAYSANGRTVLDSPGVEAAGESLVFTRTLNITAGDAPLEMIIVDVAGAKGIVTNQSAVLEAGDRATVISASSGQLSILESGRVVLRIGPETAQIKLAMWRGEKSKAAAVQKRPVGSPRDLTPLTKGGAPGWTETVVTEGQLAAADANQAYVVDTLTLPDANPYHSWMRIGGFDFLPGGKAALSTWSGDVWVCSGIDDRLDKLTWRRFATGLFHPLGLKVVDGQIFVHGRDQLTRLHDLNNDGEADYYECFHNDVSITPNFHEFSYDLETDRAGNFYFTKGGPVRAGGGGWDKIVPHHGCLMKVAADGHMLQVVARGFRAPSGMAVGPEGELTVGDNEGTWTPAVSLNWITPGGFYGVPDFAGVTPKPRRRDLPLCWIPKDIDNSNGGQVWISGNDFGPLSGQLLHTSYGTCTLFSVLHEEVGGQRQGGVVPLPLRFHSGLFRARFHQQDNALYLAGLRGWQTRAGQDGGFYRVRYTGRPYYLPTALRATPAGIALSFAVPLDRTAAEDVDNYHIEQWNYRWTPSYGSPHFKASNPKQQGHDEVEIDEAMLSDDGKTVLLKIADLTPVMQMQTRFTLQTADGVAIKNAVYHTLNVVGDQRGEINVGEFKVVTE